MGNFTNLQSNFPQDSVFHSLVAKNNGKASFKFNLLQLSVGERYLVKVSPFKYESNLFLSTNYVQALIWVPRVHF